MEPIVKLRKATGRCDREIHLDRAGKPQKCKSHGYVEVLGHNLCQRHFEIAKLAIETQL